jgi:membrane peptidoglycan carboxypeptidase
MLHLDSHGADVNLSNSRFNCIVAQVPEMYSSAYLTAPFMIERGEGKDKITIPVDPARPYFVGYNGIPSHVKSAFVSSEDSGFFQHNGIEVTAIVGAAEKNAQVGRAAVGGSTITMQTVKNLFLARDKTISRKAQEMFLAWHIEQVISKERILEIYLNMVEFGPGLYGLGRASQRFFNKSPAALSLKEAIYLASLLPAPVPRYMYYCRGSITPNYDKILRQLLERMLGLGRISQEQFENALAEPLQFSPLDREETCSAGQNHDPSDQME